VAERDVRREAEELREAEERRHVDLPHRTGAEKHPQAYREDEPGGTAADGREPGPGTEEDVPVQDRGPVPADRPTAEGVDRTDARPDR
jgi:hypothetical protein